jgi:hypothetical protein
VQDRPKDARIPGSPFLDQASDFVAMKVQSSGRLQRGYLVNGELDAFYSATSVCALIPSISHKLLIINENSSNSPWLQSTDHLL